jgi:hypothetical protein
MRQIAEEGDECEARRIKAVHALRTIARDELAKAGDPNRLRAMPDELFEFLTLAGLRILLADDPVADLRSFLGQRARRKGRPTADNERRDITIATDVAALVYDGMTIDAACEAIEKEAPVGFEMVRKIYLARRNTLDVKANLGLLLLFRREAG